MLLIRFYCLTFFAMSNFNSADFTAPNIIRDFNSWIEMLFEFQNKTNTRREDMSWRHALKTCVEDVLKTSSRPTNVCWVKDKHFVYKTFCTEKPYTELLNPVFSWYWLKKLPRHFLNTKTFQNLLFWIDIFLWH